MCSSNLEPLQIGWYETERGPVHNLGQIQMGNKKEKINKDRNEKTYTNILKLAWSIKSCERSRSYRENQMNQELSRLYPIPFSP